MPAQTPAATRSQPRPTSGTGDERIPRIPAAIPVADEREERGDAGDPEVGGDLQVEKLDAPGPVGRGERLLGLVREPRAGVLEEGPVRPLLARRLPARRR